MKIELIPKSELLDDLEASKLDVELCEKALSLGVPVYSGGSVRERLEINEKIIEKINKELERRSNDPQTA